MMILQIFYHKRHPSPWHVLSSTGYVGLQLHARLHTTLHCATLQYCTEVENCTAVYCTALHTLRCAYYVGLQLHARLNTLCNALHSTLCTLHYTAELH